MSDTSPANPSASGAEKVSSQADIFNLLSDVPDEPKSDLGDESVDEDESTTSDGSGEGDKGTSDADDEEVSGEEEEETTDEAEEDSSEEDVDEEITKASGVSFKALSKKFPTIFKDFPQLRHVIGQHSGYKEVFTTVHDAKEASEKSNVFDYLDSQIVEGNLSSIFSGFAKQDKETGTNTIGKIAERLLPDLLEVDEKAFRTATRPLLTTILRNMKLSSEKNGNKNLGIAADIASEFIFGTKDLPSLESRQDPELDNRKAALDRKEQEINSREYDRHAGSLQETATKRIYKEVLSRIDPESVLSEFDRDAKVEKVLSELSNQLQSDPTHMRIMNQLKQRLVRSGYSEEEKARFLGTYLARAKPVLGPILRKAVSTAVSKKLTRNDGRKVIPSTSKSTPTFKNGKLPSASELRNSRVTVLDVLTKTAND